MSDLSKLFSLTATAAVVTQPTRRTEEDKWAILNRDVIYVPGVPVTETTNYIVPKVNDLIWDKSQGWFYVSHVDQEGDLTSTLEPWTPAMTEGGDTDDLVVLGNISRLTSEFIICAIDYSQMPPTMIVDDRIQINGSKAKYAKVFLGNDIGATGKVVSCMYDSSGNVVSENIPLELVALPGMINKTIRRPAVCNCTASIDDGETMTLVVYDDQGGWIPPVYRLVAQNSAFVRQAESGQKYVKGTQLLSPFASSSNPSLLEIPVNVNGLASVEMRGRVWYSDNSYKDLSIDGTKMVLNGAKEYIPTIVGQRANVTLTYFLSSDEAAISANPGDITHVDETYDITTVDAIGAYSPKLYGYPVADTTTGAYTRLAWWLYNLDRQIAYEVTDKVEMATNSPAFDPALFGTVQHLKAAVTLSQVDSRFKAYRHVQAIDVTLYQSPTLNGTPWVVGFDPGQTPQYGPGLKATIKSMAANNRKLRIDSGLTDYTDWLEQLYYNIRPLRAVNSETKAPEPTHFILYIDSTHEYRYPIANWNQDLTVDVNVVNGQSVFVKWIKADSGNTELQLGVSSLVAKTA